MALQTSTGYVRLGISTGFDETKLTVNWMTFHNSNWRENNPRRVWQGIAETGTNTFDLSITEKQKVELETPYPGENGEMVTHEEQNVIIGYLPQSMETAHELLRNLSGRDCNFSGINFQLV